MKINIKKHFIAVALFTSAIGFNSCSDFGDTNISPNAATTPVTSALLTYVETFLGSDAVGATSTTNAGQLGSPSLYTGYLVQHYSQLQYPDNSLYLTSGISWDNYYVAVLEDLQAIINTNSAKPDPIAVGGNSVNQIQIARILKAYFYSIVTDKYGDVPYSKALKGDLQVPYDKQQDIYNDLFKELTEAVAGFQSSGGAITGDIVYNGDLAKWKKFANSLRLSLALRLSKVDPVKGKAEFTAALANPAGVITSNADNFALKYPGGTYNHPLFNLTLASLFAISKPLADVMNTYADPRIVKYGQKNAAGNVKGVPYGLNKANAVAWVNSNLDYSLAYDASLKTNSSTAYILTSAYVALMRAQAAITYTTGEDPFTLTQKGITDSWAQWGVTGNIATYSAAIGISGASTPLAKIQEQTWIALYGSEMNAYNEWRRTGVPALSPAPDALNTPPTIPRRSMPYGGGDTEVNRVWWDKP
jgi:hypothetical protein